MKYRHLVAIVTLAGSVFVVSTLLAQDRFTLKAPNGIEFSEFRGYEAWQVTQASLMTPADVDFVFTDSAKR
jgi:hypothetical protein